MNLQAEGETVNCRKCGKFMKKTGDWDEFPDGPYVNTEWKCVCGVTDIESDDYRLRMTVEVELRKGGVSLYHISGSTNYSSELRDEAKKMLKANIRSLRATEETKK